MTETFEEMTNKGTIKVVVGADTNDISGGGGGSADVHHEPLNLTRARFRKEFPSISDVLIAESEYAKANGKFQVAERVWAAFAVGAGHGHDAKFKEGA